MLVAQFIGIVHELMPQLLGHPHPTELRQDDHHFPALVTIGYMTERTRGICEAFPARSYCICVVPNFGSRFIAKRMEAGDPSPFERATVERPRELKAAAEDGEVTRSAGTSVDTITADRASGSVAPEGRG